MKYIICSAILIFIGCTSQKKPVVAATAQPAPAVQPSVQNAPAPTTSDSHMWSCTKGKDKRELEIVKKDDGCGLNYTRSGAMKQETVSTHGLKQCEKSEAKILSSLKKSGFQCS